MSYKLKCINREMNHMSRVLRSYTSQAKIAALTVNELERLSQSDAPPPTVFSSVGKMFLKRASIEDVISRLEMVIDSSQDVVKGIEQKLGTLQTSKSTLQEASESFLKQAMVSLP